MLILLSFLYFVYGYFLGFAFKKGSFIKYLYDKKNINVLLSIEITFVILCSIVVFLNQPLNIIVALIMFRGLLRKTTIEHKMTKVISIDNKTLIFFLS